MTAITIRALQIIKAYGRPIYPRDFARLMWPDSEGWQHSTKCGPKGVTRAGGMNLAGGAYLGKLAQRGLVQPHIETIYGKLEVRGYVLSTKGQEKLNAIFKWVQSSGVWVLDKVEEIEIKALKEGENK